MFEMAEHAPAEGLKSAEIAKAQKIPGSFLEQILAALKKAKLVKSFRGREGGYILGRLPSEITLFNIIEALEGSVAFANAPKDMSIVAETLREMENKLVRDLKVVNLGNMIEAKAEKNKTLMYTI